MKCGLLNHVLMWYVSVFTFSGKYPQLSGFFSTSCSYEPFQCCVCRYARSVTSTEPYCKNCCMLPHAFSTQELIFFVLGCTTSSSETAFSVHANLLGLWLAQGLHLVKVTEVGDPRSESEDKSPSLKEEIIGTESNLEATTAGFNVSIHDKPEWISDEFFFFTPHLVHPGR